MNRAETESVPESLVTAEDVIRDIINQHAYELPLLPESMTRLLALCNDPDCSPLITTNAIRQDPSISTHVLRLANSAMFNSGPPIISLQQAVARLGLRRLREIVIVISCKSRVYSGQSFKSELRRSFQRSLGTALFAQEIARARRLSVEDAFLIGLLHDIGTPILLHAVADQQMERKLIADTSAVVSAIGTHRADVSAQLVEEWRLPQHVADTVRQQDGLTEPVSDPAGKVLRLAIALSEWLLDETDVDFDSSHPMVALLNLYPDQMEGILAKRPSILDSIRKSS